MPKFGLKSKEMLSQAHPDLQRLFNKVIDQYDCSVICGYRGEEAQNLAFSTGNSKARFGESPHNQKPSLAVDVVPFPLDWNDIESFKRFSYYVRGVADGMGIKIRHGADWDMDFDHEEHKFKDWPHYELA